MSIGLAVETFNEGCMRHANQKKSAVLLNVLYTSIKSSIYNNYSSDC